MAMTINEDGTVDYTGMTPEELRNELLSSGGDIGNIWDGDPTELFF